MLLSRLRSVALVLFALAALSACSRDAAEETTHGLAIESESSAQVFFLRGGGAGVFSRGLDEMSQQLTEAGIENTVIPHQQWDNALDTIIKATQSRPRPKVIVIGHSLGANRAVDIAAALNGRRIRVDFLVTFAATKKQVIPRNVRKATNYYFSIDGWGEAVTAGAGFSGRLKNVDVSGVKDVNHFNVEKSDRYQRQVVNNVKRIVK